MSGVDKRIELAEQLFKATQEGRVAWHPTAVIDEFVCSLEGRYSVLVSKEDRGGRTLRMLDEDERELLRISEDDPELWKEIPPSADAPMGKVGYAWLLPQLFDLARRSALHVDQAIDEALHGLKRS